MDEHTKEKLTDVVKVQSKDVEDQVTGMILDLLEQKGFTFANFESVVARVKSQYQNNATI
ncbi:hypothetical protein M5119_10760 [Lacticaseibacillus paracasei]|jgi:DUF1009 family protein|uniref:Uncharacterized protein n=1 Tax=Lacticaseibacillus paracasei subsp. paracasei Lpp41 TaxID=1256208 RepID=A0A829H516_LACPA|nr:hypothetical protein [Lacticaseibacillus paracasei]EKQ18209.1 hypothetical protein LCAUW4_2583 [Lacticaseibacillus casei UW4]EPC71275.1 hypothetical protein Lpp41_12203 [Lacticaseibacillus paracasei subsp. paracasei Lpp41]KAB1966190.1 hypothetical protein F8272_05540 [Lacticaseibacillus paracasei]MBU6045408.1 hypothetical protein [Lacticaseibacillus paracasei]MBU6048113.1 hypothetical protein [Lacticaseibacillus paracasei]